MCSKNFANAQEDFLDLCGETEVEAVFRRVLDSTPPQHKLFLCQKVKTTYLTSCLVWVQGNWVPYIPEFDPLRDCYRVPNSQFPFLSYLTKLPCVHPNLRALRTPLTLALSTLRGQSSQLKNSFVRFKG